MSPRRKVESDEQDFFDVTPKPPRRWGLPIMAGLDFGHTDPFFTIPYGALAEMDVDALTLRILEPGVSERQGQRR